MKKSTRKKNIPKAKKKENMSNEQVPGLPQLHDPILSWYTVTWTLFLRGINTDPFCEGMEALPKFRLRFKCSSHWQKTMNSYAHLEMNELVSNPSPRPRTQSKMQFLLINEQLMFSDTRPTPLLRHFHWPRDGMTVTSALTTRLSNE